MSRARAPRCSRCRRISVLDPCRMCATDAELAETRVVASQDRSVVVANYPALPERFGRVRSIEDVR